MAQICSDSDLFGIQKNRVQKVLKGNFEMRTLNKWTPLGSVQSLELADLGKAQGKTMKCELRAKWTPLRSIWSSENQNLTVWGSAGEISETRTLSNMGPT